jgi:hypothetical protein
MKNKKLVILILNTILLSLFLIQNVLAVDATLYGEVTDDGGDPNLYVWFQYGKTTSYNKSTSMQTKNGKGEFSATITGLEMCTTYHYRAVARHQSYEDTTYGGDQSFTTPCNVVVNLKVNDSDGPINLSYQNRTITLSWTSQYADSCSAETISKPTNSSVNWSGAKQISGSESLTLDKAGTYSFRLTCRNNSSGNISADGVQVNLQQPTLSVITKGVVITY